VVVFFNKSTSPRNELGNYVKVPAYTCETTEKIAKMMEEDNVHQLLLGFNKESYSVVDSKILALDPPLSLDKIFSIIQQQENYKKVMMHHDREQESPITFSVSYVTKPICNKEK